MMVQRAVEVFDLDMPSAETKKMLLTEVLQPSQTGSETLLPFNETLTDILFGTWAKPCTGVLISRPISHRHRAASRGPEFLTQTSFSGEFDSPDVHLPP